MTKMFYNCKNIKNIVLNNNNYIYIMPNDLSSAFYNCISLTSLTLKYFQTDYLKEITIYFDFDILLIILLNINLSTIKYLCKLLCKSYW